MRRKHLDYAVIAGMLLSGLYVTLSGVVTDLFGLHQFALHRYAGYACAGLALVHMALNWRRAMAYLTHLLGRRRQRGKIPPRSAGRPSSWSRRQLLLSGLAATGGFVLGRLVGRRRVALPGDATDVGQLYHQWSKPGGLPEIGALLDWGPRPAGYKLYPEAERIALPDPGSAWGPSTAEAIEARRSVRRHAGDPLPLASLSRLCHAAQGITDPRRGFRAAPSAGALYPIELYVVAYDVAELTPGLYHYAVREHGLERLQEGDLRGAVLRAGLGQDFLAQANVCFILSAVFQRTRWRYQERTYRYVLLEAGHVGQNLYLAATALGLGACAVGAFLDDPFNALVGVDGQDEAVLYVISVGTV